MLWYRGRNYSFDFFGILREEPVLCKIVIECVVVDVGMVLTLNSLCFFDGVMV